ncbi:hypothetical protein [Aequorivita capsosiphonis]|uniref:hypothetical protein n=1 Tax=Aequorivita capsosiphonis TaxID=487317 RepID=UPI0003FD7B1E|nr:hypothetical protein [Aequorivita capsosiphonis]
MAPLFFNLILLVLQDSKNLPAPNNNPPPPNPQLPIDDHIWILLVAGLVFGIYMVYKRNKATNKAS